MSPSLVNLITHLTIQKHIKLDYSRGPMEDLVKTQLELGESKTGVVKELINEKTKRAKEWKPLLPFDMNEHEENKAGDFINKILFRHSINFRTVSS